MCCKRRVSGPEASAKDDGRHNQVSKSTGYRQEGHPYRDQYEARKKNPLAPPAISHSSQKGASEKNGDGKNQKVDSLELYPRLLGIQRNKAGHAAVTKAVKEKSNRQ